MPGLASKIAEQAQVEARHVREREGEALKASIRYHSRGQWMAFIAVLGIIGLAAFSLRTGAKWVAGIATSIVVGTASVFVPGSLRRRRKKKQGD